MKTQALKRFRAKLARNEPIYGLWVTLESASITEMAVALGMDWVVIPWVETVEQLEEARLSLSNRRRSGDIRRRTDLSTRPA